MPFDRPHEHGDYPREKTSVLTWLLCGLIAGLVLQIAAQASWLGGGASITDEFALSIAGVRAWRWWTLATHAFLHDPRFLLHGLASVGLLYLLGRELLPLLGARRFLGLFFGATVAGAVSWTAVHWRTGGSHFGALAAVHALLIVFACSFPNRPVSFLLLFIPVSVRPKHVAWALLGFAVFGLLFFELRGVPQPFGRLAVSSSAHLGGIIAGWLYFRYFHAAPWRLTNHARGNDAPPAASAGPATVTEDDADPDSTKPAESREELRARVDGILDKINSHGFGSLTPAEKRLLDEARDLLSRR